MPRRPLPVALIALLAVLIAAPTLRAGDTAPAIYRKTFQAADTLHITRDASADAQQMLDSIAWTPGPFTVTASDEPGPWDALVRFDSPKPADDPVNDTVVMEWYAARDADGQATAGPAMVVLDILDGRTRVARAFAHAFASHGIHAFVMHMPNYGPRRVIRKLPDMQTFIIGSRQAYADARRARDAIAALPNIDATRIGIQGTSLGGFVTAVAASIDTAFDPVFVTLAGGDIHNMLLNGARESAKIRQVLEAEGFTGDKLAQITRSVEPLRLAHRLNPARTWLFSAAADQVVPPANARALAKAAGLADDHHIWAWGDHYTVAVNLPVVIKQMISHIQSSATEPQATGQ